MTEEAREYLVTQYRNLRQADATGVGRSSYRITVRQLESMVRLAEGLAKLYGSEHVLIRHVMESAYLLKTSIVHVEQENVNLEDDEVEELMRSTEVGQMDIDGEDDVIVEEPVIKQKITLTAEEYQKIVQSIILQIKREEKTSGVAGMKKSALINWYMEALEAADSIDDEESLLRNRKTVKSVIQRLVRQENTLLEMKDTTVIGDEDEDDDPVIVISPSYMVE